MGGHRQVPHLPVCGGQANGRVGDAGLFHQTFTFMSTPLTFAGADARNLGLQHSVSHLGHIGMTFLSLLSHL